MRLQDIDLSKPKRLSLTRREPIPVRTETAQAAAPVVTSTTPEEYFTEEEELISWIAAKRPALERIISILDARSMRTGYRPKINPLIILSATLLEPERAYSREEVVSRIIERGYSSSEAEAVLSKIQLIDGLSYSYPESPSRIWRIRTIDSRSYWAANSTPF